MITTDSPEASLFATRGSDPTVRAPPFGGRHGTRLKMSPADFATSLTFSIALVVRLFCCAGWEWSTAATLPPVAPGVCDAGDFEASAFEVSDLALSDSVACCEVSACAGRVDAGVSNTNAATADAASDAVRQKGR